VGEGTPIEGSFGAVDWWGKVSIETEIELAGSGEAELDHRKQSHGQYD